MNDKELAIFLQRRAEGRNIVFSDEELPDITVTFPTVTIHRDRLARFRDNTAELQVFAAQVCGVPVEELCSMDMWKFLMKRHYEKEKAAEATKSE